MSDYLGRLAAKNLNIEKGVSPRVRTFFEPAAYTGSAYDGSSSFEQYSLFEKQEVLFQSNKKDLCDDSEKPKDAISLGRVDLESSSFKGAATEASSDPSSIPGQFGQDRISDISPHIYGEPHIKFRNPGKLPRSFGFKNAKYISTNKGEKASRQIEPQESDLLSKDIARKTLGLNPATFESELNHRSFDLGESKLLFHSDIYKPDLPRARREAHYRVRWSADDAHQERQDSAEIFNHAKKRPNRARTEQHDGTNTQQNESPKSDVNHLDPPEEKLGAISTKPNEIQLYGQPEQQNQNTKVDHANKKKNETSHASLMNMGDGLWSAQDPDLSKRAFLDQSLSISESKPENVDAEEVSQKSSDHRESFFGVAAGRANKSDSILDLNLEENDFKVRRTDNAHQDLPRIPEKAPPVKEDREIINEKIEGVLLSQRKPLHKSPILSKSKPENVDAEEVSRKSSDHRKSLFGVAAGRAIKSDSILDLNLEENDFKVRRADNGHQDRSRIPEKAPPVKEDREIINEKIEGVLLSHRKPLHKLPILSKSKPENVDAEEVSQKSSDHRESLFEVAAGRAIESGSIFDGKLEGNHLKVIRADNGHQDRSRNPENAPPAGVDREIVNEQLIEVLPHYSKSRQKTDRSRDPASSDFSSSNDRIIGVKMSGPDSISRDPKRANISNVGSMIAQSEVSRLELPMGQSLIKSNKTQSTIRVTIGRVEVKAAEPHPAPSVPLPRAPPLANRLSLDEYLKQRSTGQL